MIYCLVQLMFLDQTILNIHLLELEIHFFKKFRTERYLMYDEILGGLCLW